MTSANRAAALTHRLLAFARRQPLIPKSVDANQLVVSLEDLLRRTIGETHRSRDRGVATICGRRCAIPTSWKARCSISPSTRATPCRDGGRLTIATANARLDGVSADAPALSPGEYVCIDVTDTGTGMTAGGGGARLRSVLHHQADRAGHRARAVDDLWLRPAIERPCHDRQQARAGHDGQALSAAPPRESRPSRPRRPATPRTPLPARPCWWSRTSRWCAA